MVRFNQDGFTEVCPLHSEIDFRNCLECPYFAGSLSFDVICRYCSEDYESEDKLGRKVLIDAAVHQGKWKKSFLEKLKEKIGFHSC